MNGAVIIVGNYESPQRGSDFWWDLSGLLLSGRREEEQGEGKGVFLTCFSTCTLVP